MVKKTKSNIAYKKPGARNLYAFGKLPFGHFIIWPIGYLAEGSSEVHFVFWQNSLDLS